MEYWEDIVGPTPNPLVNPLDQYISELEAKHKLPPGIMKAIRQIETGGVAGDPNLAVSSAGALGQFQMKPGTAGDYAQGANLQDPRQSAELAAQHLARLQNSYGITDPQKLAMTYQMGEGNAQKYGLSGLQDYSKLPPETQGYARKFSQIYQPTSVSAGVAPPAIPPPPVIPTNSPGPPPSVGAGYWDEVSNAEPSMMESIANKAGAVGDFFGGIGQSLPARIFSGVMGAQKEHIADPLLGKALGYDPSKGETFESHTGSLLGAGAKELGVPGSGSPIVSGLASGAWEAFAGMASDPLMYELAALGTVLGPAGTAAGGLTGAAVSGIRTFLNANRGLSKAVTTANKLAGKGFQAQMALGMATKLPKAVEQISLNPQNPEGYSNLAGGLIDSYFTTHSLIPRALRKGVSDYDIPGIGKVEILGPGGQPVPYEIAHQLLSEPAIHPSIRLLQDISSETWAEGVSRGEFVGEMPILKLGIGTGARGEVLRGADGRVNGVMFDPTAIIMELQADPTSNWGAVLQQRVAAAVGHEFGKHIKLNFAIPHSLPVEVRTFLTEGKLNYDAELNKLQGEMEALQAEAEKGMPVNPMRVEELKTAQSELLSNYLAGRFQVLDALSKKTGVSVEDLVGAESETQLLFEGRREWLDAAAAKVFARWEGALPEGFEGMVRTFMDKTGQLEASHGVPLQTPETAQLAQGIAAGKEPVRPTTPEDLSVAYERERTLVPGQQMAEQIGLPAPPITPKEALKRPVFDKGGEVQGPQRPNFFSEGQVRRTGNPAIDQLLEESNAARQMFEEAKTPEEKAYAAEELSKLEVALREVLPPEQEEPTGPPPAKEPYRFSVSGRSAEQIRQGPSIGVPPQVSPEDIAKRFKQDPQLYQRGFRVREGTGKERLQLRHVGKDTEGAPFDRLVEPIGNTEPLNKGRIEGLKNRINTYAKEQGIDVEALRSSGPARSRDNATLITTPESKGEAEDVRPVHSLLQASARKYAEDRTAKLEKSLRDAEKRVEALEARFSKREGVIEKEGETFFRDEESVAAPMEKPSDPFEGQVWEATRKAFTEAKGGRANMGQIVSQFSGPEKGRASKLAQGYLRSMESGGEKKVTETRTSKAIGGARMEAESLRQKRQKGISPEEWRESLEKVPAKKEEFTYPAVMDWLNEQKAAGREEIPVEDVIKHLEKYSPVVRPESRHREWPSRVPPPPEVAEKEVQKQALDQKVSDLTDQIMEKTKDTTVKPFNEGMGRGFFEELTERTGGDLSPKNKAKAYAWMEEVVDNISKRKFKLIEHNKKLNKLLGFLRGENTLTFGDARSVANLGFYTASSVADRATNRDRWGTPPEREVQLPERERKQILDDYESLSPSEKEYYLGRFNEKGLINDLRQQVDALPSELGMGENWMDFWSKEAKAAGVDWDNMNRYAKDDWIYHAGENKPSVAFAKKLVEKLPTLENGLRDFDTPEVTRFRQEIEDARSKSNDLQYDIDSARSRVGEGRSTSYEGYNRTPGDTEYKEAPAIPAGAPYVPKRAVEELGMKEEIEVGPATAIEDVVISRPAIRGKKATTSGGPVSELPRPEMKERTSLPVGPPELRESAIQQARNEAIAELGERFIPHVNPWKQHGYPGSFHNRVESWKFAKNFPPDAGEPANDTYAVMETQSDVMQKAEKFGGWSPGWDLRRQALEKASKKTPAATNVEGGANLRRRLEDQYSNSDFRNKIAEGKYADFFNMDPSIKPAVLAYIERMNEYRKNNGQAPQTLYQWLAETRKNVQDYRAGRAYDVDLDTFVDWMKWDWVPEGSKENLVGEKLTAAAALQRKFPGDYPWRENWVEQSAKVSLGEAILRGFKNFALNHSSYAKTTAGDNLLQWQYKRTVSSGKPVPDVVVFGTTSANYANPTLTSTGKISQAVQTYSGSGLSGPKIERRGNRWFHDGKNLDWQIEQAEKFLGAVPNIEVFTKSGELTPAGKKALSEVSPKWSLNKFMSSPLYRTFAEGQPQQDFIAGHMNNYDRLAGTVRMMRNTLAELTEKGKDPSYTGGNTGVRSEAFDKFIGGKVKGAYTRLFNQLGGLSPQETVEKLKAQNPDIKIIEEPTAAGEPALISMEPEGARGSQRFVWMWPDIQGLRNKLPVVEGGRMREPGDTSPGIGFFATKGSVRRGGRELYGFDPLQYTDFASKPGVEKAKEGSYWNFQKVDHPLWEAINTPRALITSLDLSGVLRQGLVATSREMLTNPMRLADNFKKSLKALTSEDFYQRSMASLENAPSMQELKSFGMDFAQKEEAYAGTRVLTTLAKKFGLPDFPRASERAYTYYLNRIRYELGRDKFNRLKEMGFSPEKDKWLFESAAKWSNVITGRGNLPSGKDPLSQAVRSAEGLMNTVLFSPRLMLSRLAMINPYVYGRTAIAAGKSKGATGAVGAFWAIHGMDVAAVAGLAGALTAGIKAAYGGDIEDDPRSSDFAQARIGNTRVDLTGGMRTYFTAAARLLTGEQKSTIGGNIREVGALETIGRFARGKLSPVPGTVADLISGKKVTGEETLGPGKDILSGREPLTKESALEFAKVIMEGPVSGLTIPMILRDLKNLYEEDPSVAMGLAAPLILGAGVTVHDLRGGLTPKLRDTFKRTMIEPMSPMRSLSSGVNDLSGRPISIDVPYMMRKQLETEVDRPLYSKLEEMVSTPQFEALTPVQQRIAILSALTPLYKGRGAKALQTVGKERIVSTVKEKMVPKQWKVLGPPPILPGSLTEVEGSGSTFFD